MDRDSFVLMYMVERNREDTIESEKSYCYRVPYKINMFEQHLCMKFSEMLLYLSTTISEIQEEKNIKHLTQDRSDIISLHCNRHKNLEVIFLLIMLEKMGKGKELAVEDRSEALAALLQQSIIQNKLLVRSSTIKHFLVYFA